MTKALLLTAGFGDGHHQVANALRESFRRRNVEVVEVDCFEGTSPTIARLNEGIYQFLTRYIPWIYGLSYRLTANLPVHHVLWKLLALFSGPALMDAVTRHQPDIILQLFPDHAITRLPSTQRRLLGVVVTDFSVHSRWFHKSADVYFIGNQRMHASICKLLPETVTPFVDAGIPIRAQFQLRSDTNVANKQPYVVLATGGRGVFPQLESVLTAILTHLPNFHVYVLCGRNKRMYCRVNHLAQTHHRLHGLSFVANVAEWFQGASFAVVKAGGLTVSECLVTHTPMLFYRPQPGQEYGNALFLEQAGAGIVIGKVDEFAKVFDDSFHDRLRTMKQVCCELAKPHAADSIVDYVLSQIERTEK